ncbi:MAG: MBL fold metallo-hydrolase, partial [Synergistaceae bacterium]|nr:MBL fold metallo-hydrolase [Synergistaceae bacterium]
MNEPFSYPNNFLRFLGTGGARFAMLKQLRKTGGIWFTYGGLNGVVDPGPGSLYHMCSATPPLDPHELRAIMLTHRHLDHSTDINVTAEAMTGG